MLALAMRQIGMHTPIRVRIRKREMVAGKEKLVEAVNVSLARYETIKKVALLPRELTVEAGEITPTMKVKRRAVEARYAAQVEAMYR